VNSCELKQFFHEGVEQPKIRQKTPEMLFFNALLMSHFQNFVAGAANIKKFFV